MQPTKSRVDRHTQRKIDKNTTRQTKTKQGGQKQCKSEEKTAWRTITSTHPKKHSKKGKDNARVRKSQVVGHKHSQEDKQQLDG